MKKQDILIDILKKRKVFVPKEQEEIISLCNELVADKLIDTLPCLDVTSNCYIINEEEVLKLKQKTKQFDIEHYTNYLIAQMSQNLNVDLSELINELKSQYILI